MHLVDGGDSADTRREVPLSFVRWEILGRLRLQKRKETSVWKLFYGNAQVISWELPSTASKLRDSSGISQREYLAMFLTQQKCAKRMQFRPFVCQIEVATLLYFCAAIFARITWRKQTMIAVKTDYNPHANPMVKYGLIAWNICCFLTQWHTS